MTTATLYIEGQAAHWLQAFRQTHGGLAWDAFCAAIKEEFGVDEFEMEMHKLLQLRQTGTVSEYRKEFDTHMYHLLALDPSLSNKFFITQFLLGLKDKLRAAVRLQAPNSITRASILARIQEEELNTPRARPRPQPQGRPPPVPARPPAAPRQQPDDYARERQLKEFRRANGLCFKCGDRYTRDHRCNTQAQLLTIQVGAYGELLTDDTVHALDLLDAPEQEVPPPECCTISAHTLDGSEAPNTIRLRALVGNQVMLLLLDSGSTHSFVNKTFVERVGATTKEIATLDVRVANGDRLTCSRQVPELKWWMQGHTFSTPM